ncbi:MAG: hypothetical protein GY838_13665 [bacterium]|nr:hypothetical protein [bacterium]
MPHIPVIPAAGEYLDLESTGLTHQPGTFSNVRNVRFRDDNTPTRRGGLVAHHRPFEINDSGNPLQGLLTNYECQGCYHYERVPGVTAARSSTYLAKVEQYLVGSLFGDDFVMPLADNLGATSVPDFTEYYILSERRNYIIVLTNDDASEPVYWDGRYGEWSADTFDFDKWGFFKRIPHAPRGAKFGRVHNGRFWLGGHADYEIQASGAGDFRDFTSSPIILFMDPSFGPVTAFFETYYGELLVGQARGISRIIFSNGVPVQVDPVRSLSSDGGPVNNRSVARVGNDHYYLTADGVLRSLATTEQYGDFLFSAKSFKIHKALRQIPKAAADSAFLINDPDEEVLWMSLSVGSGVKNDTLLGYDYNRDRWLRDENKSIGGMSGAALCQSNRYNGLRKVMMSNYRTVDDGGATVGGKIWLRHPTHKEDAWSGGKTEVNETSAPLYLQARLVFPDEDAGNGGWPTTGVTVTTTGNYDVGASTTIVLRANAGGTIGTGNWLAEWEDKVDDPGVFNSVDLGAYNLDADLSLGNNINLQFASGSVVTEGMEIYIHVDQNKTIDMDWNAEMVDLATGNGINEGPGAAGSAYNFVPILETPWMFSGNPHAEFQLDGLSVITRVVGNRADTETDDDEDSAGQNQFRYSLDVYVMVDESREWRWIGCLDGNAAQRFHLDPSKSEIAGGHADRDVAGDGTGWQLVPTDDEATADPLATDEDVNMEFVRIGSRTKRFKLRFDQLTPARTDVSDGGDENNAWGAHDGDFNLVGYQIHLTPGEEGDATDGGGTMSVFGDLGLKVRGGSGE